MSRDKTSFVYVYVYVCVYVCMLNLLFKGFLYGSLLLKTALIIVNNFTESCVQFHRLSRTSMIELVEWFYIRKVSCFKSLQFCKFS